MRPGWSKGHTRDFWENWKKAKPPGGSGWEETFTPRCGGASLGSSPACRIDVGSPLVSPGALLLSLLSYSQDLIPSVDDISSLSPAEDPVQLQTHMPSLTLDTFPGTCSPSVHHPSPLHPLAGLLSPLSSLFPDSRKGITATQLLKPGGIWCPWTPNNNSIIIVPVIHRFRWE